MADEPNPYRLFVSGDINRVRGGLNSRSSLINIDGVAAVRNATANSYRTGQIPKSGPYRAQVIRGYPKELGPPPGYESDIALQDPNTGQIRRMPWCVVRVYGANENLLDPARFDPLGDREKQRKHLAAAVMHQNTGICLPDGLNPDYPVPQPGDFVQVTFTDVRSFSGGIYRMQGTDLAAATGMYTSMASGLQRALDISFPGGVGTNPLGAVDVPLITGNPVGTRNVRTTPSGPPNDEHGYESARVRNDVADRMEAIRDELESVGSYLTTAGGLRSLGDEVTSGRAPLSLHYLGLGFDLATRSGVGTRNIENVERNPYLVERYDTGTTHRNGNPKFTWHIWARVPEPYGQVRTIQALHDPRGDGGRIVPITARVVSLTNLARSYGMVGIGNRAGYPGSYGNMEWWHLEARDLIGDSTFGELLLQVRDPEEVARTRFSDPENFNARFNGYFRRA